MTTSTRPQTGESTRTHAVRVGVSDEGYIARRYLRLPTRAEMDAQLARRHGRNPA